MTQSAQVAAAEKLKSVAKESSKTSDQAAAVSALEAESESDEEVAPVDVLVLFNGIITALLSAFQQCSYIYNK